LPFVLTETSRRWRSLGTALLLRGDPSLDDPLSLAGFGDDFSDYAGESGRLSVLAAHRPSRQRAARELAEHRAKVIKRRIGFWPNGIDPAAARMIARCFELADAHALYAWLSVRRWHPHTKKSSSPSTREGMSKNIDRSIGISES